MQARHVILILSVALLASFAGALAYRHVYFQPEGDGVSAADLIGQPRPDYRIASVSGEWVNAEEFDGQTVLLNFWATWCAPCRKEMPMLQAFYQDMSGQGLVVVGVAMDEVKAAMDFARDIGVTYPVLVGTTDVLMMIGAYGNRSGALPYSVLIDSDGIIRWTYTGELDAGELKQQVEQVLR